MAGALSSVLQVSVSAKEVALSQGLVELLCAQLGAIQSYLILEPGETMKRLATRKKVGIQNFWSKVQTNLIKLQSLNLFSTGLSNFKRFGAYFGIIK